MVTQAVDRRGGCAAALATGWPVLAWVAKFRRTPCAACGSAEGGAARRSSRRGPPRTSLPPRSGVQRARVDTALRALAEDASTGCGPAGPTRSATTGRSGAGLSDALDRASRPPTSTSTGTAAGGAPYGCCSGSS